MSVVKTTLPVCPRISNMSPKPPTVQASGLVRSGKRLIGVPSSKKAPELRYGHITSQT
jgi:hypothetical protein